MKEPRTTIFKHTHTITANETTQKPSAILARETGLSQQTLKAAMQKGAVWLYQEKRDQRLRRNNKKLHPGDQLQLFYNTAILNQEPPAPSLISDEKDYSIWYKPYGLFCQGSKWGDACTINRWVEVHSHIPVRIYPGNHYCRRWWWSCRYLSRSQRFSRHKRGIQKTGAGNLPR